MERFKEDRGEAEGTSGKTRGAGDRAEVVSGGGVWPDRPRPCT